MNEIVSINPATLEEIGRVPISSQAKVAELVSAARAAQPRWRRRSFRERGEALLRARRYLLDHLDEIARVITIDNGKPLTESITAEILPVAHLLHHFAIDAEKALHAHRLPIGMIGWLRRRSSISYQPHGVVGVISPWNFPFSIAAGEVAMALVCGNAVLLKPSSATPFVGKAIEEVFRAADLPPHIFTHLPGTAETGRALIAAQVDKIAFTGSVGVGKEVMQLCAEHLTSPILELGGKDPMIVREDADLEQATSGAVWGAFTNCGQCCASVERVYVHESLFDAFVELATRKALALKVGNGLDPEVNVGPLTTEAQLLHVERHVAEAKERGACIHCGGERLTDRAGFFFPPTILTQVDHSFACVRDETFGPLLPIMPFSNDEQAVKLANESAYGLTASIWTRDIAKGKCMAADIMTGTVTINDCVFTHALPQTPWGGRKQSGFGRSHSRHGLLEFVSPHHLHINRLRRKDLWWYGYSFRIYQLFSQLARTLTGGIVSQIRSLPTFWKLWREKKL